MSDVEIRYATRIERRARRDIECTGGTSWCQPIYRGDLYTALVLNHELVGKWCQGCRPILERGVW